MHFAMARVAKVAPNVLSVRLATLSGPNKGHTLIGE